MMEQENKLKDMIEKISATLTSAQDKVGKQVEEHTTKVTAIEEQLEEMKEQIEDLEEDIENGGGGGGEGNKENGGLSNVQKKFNENAAKRIEDLERET